jgi:hypothetical protein
LAASLLTPTEGSMIAKQKSTNTNIWYHRQETNLVR